MQAAKLKNKSPTKKAFKEDTQNISIFSGKVLQHIQTFENAAESHSEFCSDSHPIQEKEKCQ